MLEQSGVKNQIDTQQERIDQLDQVNDNAIAGYTKTFFSKVDRFQERIAQSQVPPELKAAQVGRIIKLLQKVGGDSLKELDKDVSQTLDQFNQTLEEIEALDYHRVTPEDSLGKLVTEKLHVSWKDNPQLFFAGIQALQEFRTTHGANLVVLPTGGFEWQVGSSFLDEFEPNEYLDLKVLDGLKPRPESIRWYIETTQNLELRRALDAWEKTVDAPTLEAGTATGDQVLDLVGGKLKYDSTLPSIEELEGTLAYSLFAGMEGVNMATLGFAKLENPDDFHQLVESLETDEDRRAFAEALLQDLLTQQEQEIQLNEQQNRRIEQLKLMNELCGAVHTELSTESKTWASPIIRWWVGEETIAAKRGKLEEIMNTKLPAAAQALALDPNQTVEGVLPDLVALFRNTGYTPVDFKETNSSEELNLQRAQAMEYLRNLRHFEPLKALAEETMQSEFDAARLKVKEEDLTKIREDAKDTVDDMAAEYKAAWKNEGVTDAQAEEFIQKLVDEETQRQWTALALKEHFDPESLPADKKAAWDVYNNAFDPKGEWFTMEDENFYFMVKEAMINAPLIILSGGVASLARAGLSAGTLAFIRGSSLAVYGTRAYEASRIVRAATVVGGVAVEGTAFALTHNALLKGLGLEEKWLLEMPDAMQQVFWSCVTLGAFKAAGEGAKVLGGAVDRRLAAQFMRFKGVAHPEKFRSVLESVAKDISNDAARKVIQNVIVSGNIEAATMLVLSAVQTGVYTGDLDAFFGHFEQELFHAYVAAGSLKAAGAGAGAVKEFAAKKVKAKVDQGRNPTLENAKLEPKARLGKASEILTRPLNAAEREAILRAHEVGTGGKGKYTTAELLEKSRILKAAGFSAVERRQLMENGITGAFERVAASIDNLTNAIWGRGESVSSQPQYRPGDKVFTEFGPAKVLRSKEGGFFEVITPDGVRRTFGQLYLDRMAQDAQRATSTGDLGREVNTPKGVGKIFGVLEDGSLLISLRSGKTEIYSRSELVRPKGLERPTDSGIWRRGFDALVQAGRYTAEARNILAKGIKPTARVEVRGGGEFFCSEVFTSKEGYLHAVAFVNIGGVLHPRFFYKSNSAGFWRSAPGVKDGVYSKGKQIHYTQETRVVPELEYHLDQLSPRAQPEPVSIPGLFDKGSGMTHPNLDTYKREVDVYSSPSLNDARRIKPGKGNDSMQPAQMRAYLESLRYPQGFIPNFEAGPVAVFTRNHALLGPVKLMVYEARLDGHPVEWRMAIDPQGRAWVDSIAFSGSEVSSFGTNRMVIDSGVLTSKPLEYNYDQYRQAMGVEGRDFKQYDEKYADQSPILSSLLPVRLFLQSLEGRGFN